MIIKSNNLVCINKIGDKKIFYSSFVDIVQNNSSAHFIKASIFAVYATQLLHLKMVITYINAIANLALVNQDDSFRTKLSINLFQLNSDKIYYSLLFNTQFS